MNPLARVNPATRIAAGLILTLPLLLTLDPVSSGVALGLEAVAFALLGWRPKAALRRTWPVLAAAPVAATSMLLYGRAGGETYLHWGLIHVTSNSAELAAAVALRVLALGLPAVLLVSGIDPTELADSLAQVVRLPSRFVLGTLAGARLAGRFRADWRQLELARRARGLGDTAPVTRWLNMAFGLLVLALRRASRLATAMEARAFGHAGPRTWARPSRVGAADALALSASLAIVVTAVGISAWTGQFRMVWE